MKLSTRWAQLTTAEREALAAKVQINPKYLYQIAVRWRGKRASVGLISKLAEADPKLTIKDMVAEFAD